MSQLPDRRRGIETHRTARLAIRKAHQVALTGFAMLSLLVVAQNYGAQRGLPPATPAPEPPNAPGVPAVSVTPTDTSVLASTSAASLDAGDTHDSTMWRIRKASDASVVWADTTADSLTSWRGNGAGYTIPLETDTVYNIDAQHHGSVSVAWSGFGTATQFTASAADPSVFIFHSDWSTATGASDAAVLDGSKDYPWDSPKGTTAGTVVTDTVDWGDATEMSSANALTIRHVDVSSVEGVRLGGTTATSGTLPEFTSGNRGYRFYLKYLRPDGSVSMTDRHPLQDGSPGSGTNWEFNATMNNTGEWTPYWEITGADDCTDCGGSVGAQEGRWTLGGAVQTDASTRIPKDSVYRFEMRLIMHSSGDSIRMEARIYNADGTLRNDVEDWLRVSDDEPMTSEIWYDSPLSANWVQHTRLQLGGNGWGGATTEVSYIMFQYGGTAVCTDWCGPYADGR